MLTLLGLPLLIVLINRRCISGWGIWLGGQWWWGVREGMTRMAEIWVDASVSAWDCQIRMFPEIRMTNQIRNQIDWMKPDRISPDGCAEGEDAVDYSKNCEDGEGDYDCQVHEQRAFDPRGDQGGF